MILLYYIEHYFWLLMFLIGLWGVIQDALKISKTPDSENRKLALNINFGQGIVLNLPWLIMGLGFLDPKVTSLFRFLQPFPFKTAVWAFYASVLLCWFVGFLWIFFLGGDQALAKLPPLFAIRGKTRQKIRLKYLLTLPILLLIFAILIRINPVHFYQ